MQTKPRELGKLSWPARRNFSAKAAPQKGGRARGRAREPGSLNSHEGPVLLIVLNKTTGAK